MPLDVEVSHPDKNSESKNSGAEGKAKRKKTYKQNNPEKEAFPQEIFSFQSSNILAKIMSCKLPRLEIKKEDQQAQNNQNFSFGAEKMPGLFFATNLNWRISLEDLCLVKL